jgi:hypothetical protein
MWDFVMDKSGAGAGFLRELRFPLPIYIPSVLHNHLHYHPWLAQLAWCGCCANSLTNKIKKNGLSYGTALEQKGKGKAIPVKDRGGP